MKEDARHWESLKEGNREGLRALYEQYADALYAYGMILCRDEEKVKDCIQDLFVAFWQNHASLPIPDSGKAYLMVSLRRRIFEKTPKKQLTTEVVEDAEIDRLLFTIDHETTWITEEEEKIKMEKLASALSQLSERQQEMIHMKYFQQMEYEEIGQIMEINYQSARNLVTRALIALRKALLLIILSISLYI